MQSDKNLKSIMLRLLNEKTTDGENEFLTEYGFKVKGATKQTVLAAALYKRAAGGDLSAIKEIINILGGASPDKTEREAVTIIDDTKS